MIGGADTQNSLVPQPHVVMENREVYLGYRATSPSVQQGVPAVHWAPEHSVPVMGREVLSLAMKTSRDWLSKTEG